MITADFKDKFPCRLAGMKRIFNSIFQQVERSHQHLIYDVIARDSQLNQANRQTYLINCPISRGNRASHFYHCIKRESVDPGAQIYSSRGLKFLIKSPPDPLYLEVLLCCEIIDCIAALRTTLCMLRS